MPARPGETLRLAGDEEAIREAAWAVEVERAFDAPYELANALDELGRLVRPTDLQRAHELHHDALTLRLQHGIRLGYVDSLDALARLDADAGNPAHATRLLAAAGRHSMHYPVPAVDRADHGRAVDLLRETLGEEEFDVAWTAGLGWDLDQAVAVISRGRGPRRRPMTGWDSLTPAEREVVDLVVAGLSNPQVAQRLAMSRSTVKAHLTHIYAKLGVANRTQLAAGQGQRPTAGH
jgi:DNA-binding CsgD family transcriptional regulator